MTVFASGLGGEAYLIFLAFSYARAYSFFSECLCSVRVYLGQMHCHAQLQRVCISFPGLQAFCLCDFVYIFDYTQEQCLVCFAARLEVVEYGNYIVDILEYGVVDVRTAVEGVWMSALVILIVEIVNRTVYVRHLLCCMIKKQERYGFQFYEVVGDIVVEEG